MGKMKNGLFGMLLVVLVCGIIMAIVEISLLWTLVIFMVAMEYEIYKENKYNAEMRGRK